MALVVSQLTLLDWLAAHPVRACEPSPEPATLDGLTRTVGGITYTLSAWRDSGGERVRVWTPSDGRLITTAALAVTLWPQGAVWSGCCPELTWRRADPYLVGALQWLGPHDTREEAEAAADAALLARLAAAPAPLARTHDTRQETR